MQTPMQYGFESWEQMALKKKADADAAEKKMEDAKRKMYRVVGMLEALVIMLEKSGKVRRSESQSILSLLNPFA